MSTPERKEYIVEKEPVLEKVQGSKSSALSRYQDFFVGSRSLVDLLKYEFATMFLMPMPGALGLVLRKAFYPHLFRHQGAGVVFGRNINLRQPGNIELGNNVVIDDNCTLDAKEVGNGSFVIGDNVLISQNTLMVSKGATIRIGADSSIGTGCRFYSNTGLEIGKSVMVGGDSTLGGGRYRTDDINTPIKDQGLYSYGPVIIEDDVWIGTGCIIQDGVHIKKGSVIGAGAVIRDDVPEYTIVVPHIRTAMIPRDRS